MDDALAATSSEGQIYLRASLDRQRLDVTHATSGRSFSFPVPSTAQAVAQIPVLFDEELRDVAATLQTAPPSDATVPLPNTIAKANNSRRLIVTSGP